MYIDSQTQFSDDQEVLSGTVVGTNVYDTGSAMGIGVGEPVMFYATMTTAPVGGTSVQATLQHSDTAGGTYVDLAAGPVRTIAGLTADRKLAAFSVPHGSKRFLRAAYVVVGINTAGKVHASLTLDVDGNNEIAPSGIPRI